MPATKSGRQHPDEMRSEYDFTGGVRGKYASRFARGTNVLLAPDVAEVFKTSKAVNDALRSQLGPKPTRQARRPPRR